MPSDYVDVLRTAVPAAVEAAGIDPADVIGIGTDFTACTMVPDPRRRHPAVRATDEFADQPHAYVKLWKHHAAQAQADRINELARERGEKWLPRYGGLISSEWEFAKGLQLLEEAPEVYAAMDHWVEAADWIVWQLTGTYVRNACTAGYKGIRQDGAYPSRDFLAALNPAFADFVEDKVEHEIGQLGAVGRPPQRPGRRLDRSARGHPGRGRQRRRPRHGPRGGCRRARPDGRHHGHLHLPRHELRRARRGAGHVRRRRRRHRHRPLRLRGRPVRRRRHLRLVRRERRCRASYEQAARAAGLGVHEHLTALAAEQPIGAHGLVALDWWSGNRSVLVDHDLSGLVVGHTLATRPEDVYRALLESTAFGARVIVETFAASGVPVTEFIVTGGLQKNALLMQIYADVLDMPLSVVTSSQGPALGSALHAAVAAGAYPDVPTAAAGDGPAPAGGATPRSPRTSPPTTGCTPSTASCTTTSAAARSGAMRTLKAIRREAARVTATTPISDAVRATVDRLRAEVADLHAELARYGLVIWTAGNVSARVPGATSWSSSPRASRYDDLDAGAIVVTDLVRRPGRGRAAPVLRHRRPRLRLPAHAARRAASCTPTPPTPPPGPPAASRSRACSPWSPTSSAARSRSARSRSSATTRSGAASSRRCRARAAAPC